MRDEGFLLVEVSCESHDCGDAGEQDQLSSEHPALRANIINSYVICSSFDLTAEAVFFATTRTF